MTREEQYQQVQDYKFALELIINRDYIPLQTKMDKLLEEQNLEEYMKLEASIAPLRTQIELMYDELLRLRNEFKNRFDSSH